MSARPVSKGMLRRKIPDTPDHKSFWTLILFFSCLNNSLFDVHWNLRDNHITTQFLLSWRFSPTIPDQIWESGEDQVSCDSINCNFRLVCRRQWLNIAKLSASQIKSWVALSFLVGCLSVRPDRWHLHLSPLYDVLDHTNPTWCMCGGVWWCLDHVWWCLVLSGPCLVVSGALLMMLMDIDL